MNRSADHEFGAILFMNCPRTVAAIAYYTASIAHLILEGVHRQAEALDPTLATALAEPFILELVWWNVRRLRKRHHVA